MGYTSKENFMEKMEASNVFTKSELDFLKNSIEAHKELGDDIVLKLGTINELEDKGMLKRFYNICKENNIFPISSSSFKAGSTSFSVKYPKSMASINWV